MLRNRYARRNVTKGQHAMAVARMWPDTEQGKRETSLNIKEVGVNAGYLSQARAVLREAPDLADAVVEAYAAAEI